MYKKTTFQNQIKFLTKQLFTNVQNIATIFKLIYRNYKHIQTNLQIQKLFKVNKMSSLLRLGLI
jgi:hypothetical protein